jgi:hypothetical protein
LHKLLKYSYKLISHVQVQPFFTYRGNRTVTQIQPFFTYRGNHTMAQILVAWGNTV